VRCITYRTLIRLCVSCWFPSARRYPERRSQLNARPTFRGHRVTPSSRTRVRAEVGATMAADSPLATRRLPRQHRLCTLVGSPPVSCRAVDGARIHRVAGALRVGARMPGHGGASMNMRP
jgi:hypothetical protein